MVKLVDIAGKAYPYRVTFSCLNKWEQQHDAGYIELLQRSRIADTIDLFILGFEAGAKAEGAPAPTAEQVTAWLDDVPGLSSLLQTITAEQIVSTTVGENQANEKKPQAAQAK